jgi:hypothetical protein
MKRKPNPSDQLPLVLPTTDPVMLPSSDEPSLVAAVADLLIQVATLEARAKGGANERKDP